MTFIYLILSSTFLLMSHHSLAEHPFNPISQSLIPSNDLTFDSDGFASISRKEKGKTIQYLVDRAGKRYKVAYDLDQVNANITALDLRKAHKTYADLLTSLAKYPQLKILLINRLETFPEYGLPLEIGELKNLEVLIIKKGGKLTELHDNFTQLRQLKVLVLSNSQLAHFPKMDAPIERLNLEGNRFKTFPSSVLELKELTHLNLNHNEFYELPEDIGVLNQLVSLHLANTGVGGLPESIGDLSLLVDLNLLGNNLHRLPESIENLCVLERINLRGNDLQSIPSHFWQLSALKLVDLTGHGSVRNVSNYGGAMVREHYPGNPSLDLVAVFKDLQVCSKDLQISINRGPISDHYDKQNTLVIHFNIAASKGLPKEIYQLKNLKYLEMANFELSYEERQRIKSALSYCQVIIY